MKAVPEMPEVPSPPAMGDCVTTLIPSQPGASPVESAHKLIRSGDGKMRVDSGDISVISDPASKRTILLDHVKKEAKALSMDALPQPPGMPAMPQMPQMPGVVPPGLPTEVPKPTATTVQDLGTRIIDGEMAEGRRVTMQPPQMPTMPQRPDVPGMAAAAAMSKIPQAPGLPGAPQMPQPPQAPTVGEIWTNTQLHLPVLTTVKGDFGQQTCKCKNTAIPEPSPSLFQIPPDYKDLTKVPQVPSVPALPHK